MRKRVGVRALRQNLSVYLRRVKEGGTLEVTERGRPVALLRPLPKTSNVLDRLVAEGRARATRGDLLDLPPPLRNRGRRLTEVVDELRQDRL